jgi:MHS family proline/betaine transporter-like MFS transporter
VPLLNLLQDTGTSNAVKGAWVFGAGAVVGLMAGPGPAMLSEMFPTSVRYTGLGLAYALSNAVFSGCAGLIITESVKRTGTWTSPRTTRRDGLRGERARARRSQGPRRYGEGS